MKKFIVLIYLTTLFLPIFAARLQVVTTYPYIACLVEQVGQDRVRVHALAGGQWDPHTIVPKPSFIAKLRRADLLVINGAQLEIGWLPPLMNQANNPRTNVGTQGLLDLSRFVELIDVPESISRAQGDIHPDGNPHYYLDPHNIPALAEAIADRMAELDFESAEFYLQNCDAFVKKWNDKLPIWDQKIRSLQGKWIIEYHKNYDYLLHRYQIKLLGTVESLPGIPPTSRHIVTLEQKIRNNPPSYILQDVYNSDEASQHLSRKHDIPLIKLPHDVDAVREVEGIFSLFDEIARRLINE